MRWRGRKKWRSGGAVEEKGWEEEKKRWKEGEEGAQKGKRRGEKDIECTTHVSVLI